MIVSLWLFYVADRSKSIHVAESVSASVEYLT